MPLPLLLLLGKLFDLLVFLSPPDGIPFRKILGLFLPLLLDIGFMDGELFFLVECSRTENGRGLGGDWNHGVDCIGENSTPSRGCNRMQLFDLWAYLGCKE